MSLESPALAILDALQDSVFSLPDEGPILFVYGAPGPLLEALPKGRACVYQPFQPEAKLMEQTEWKVAGEEIFSSRYPAIFVLAPKQHDECRYVLARSLEALGDGGLIVCAAGNSAGGKRLADDLSSTGLVVCERSKHKSRVVYGRIDWKNTKREVLASWIAGGTPRYVEAIHCHSQPGLFSWNHLDGGSSLLLEHLPENLSGYGADFGCGYGALSCRLIQRDSITRLLCVDADARALDACRKNIAASGNADRADFLWHDLTRPLPRVSTDLDFVVMNPPFHRGSDESQDIGRAFIRTAHAALRAGGLLYMVANIHLGYEREMEELFSSHKIVVRQAGYKIIEGIK